MLITSRQIGLGILGLFALSSTVWATPAAVQGSIIDAKGQPLSGAEIRFENPAGGGSVTAVKSDTKGHYIYNGLTAGNIYRVSLVLNGAVKASINNVKTRIGDPTALNFDLRKDPSAAKTVAKTGKHKIWVPSETGSNLGGKWVEVDDENPQGKVPGTENVKKAGNDAIRSMQMGSR